MDLKSTRYDINGAVATITLSRPDRLNAWTGRMHAEYRHLVDRAESDMSVRALVVTGDGRGFCAGADSKALEAEADAGGYDDGLQAATAGESASAGIAEPGYGVRKEFDAPFAFHFGLRLPVVAAVNGPAAGVGLVLACFADIRFVATDAKLTAAHGRLGLPAEFGLSWLLPRLVGASRSAELLLTSRVFTGEEAHRIGLAHRALPAAEVKEAAQGYARMLAAEISPESIRMTKRQLWGDLCDSSPAQSVQTATELTDQAMGTADFREGAAALGQRRPPNFDT